MDCLKLALTELANMSERRTARPVAVDSHSGILPMFLTQHGDPASRYRPGSHIEKVRQLVKNGTIIKAVEAELESDG